MMLDQYRQDFNSLIERLHLMQDYEKGGEGSRLLLFIRLLVNN